MADEQQTDDEQGEILPVDPETPPEVQDTDDGGAIITTGPDTQPADEGDFYDNLLDGPMLSLSDINTMTTELIDRIEEDKQSRKEFDKVYAEGIKRTGLGDDAPGGASFQGASRAVHPMLSKAAIDYNSRAMAEIFQANGVVKDYIPGDQPTKVRVEKARRKTAYMNWQLKVQIPEFRSSLDQITTQTPVSGGQFLFWAWDHKRKRPTTRYWPTDMVVFPYGSPSVYTSERFTLLEEISEFEFKQRVSSGEYYIPPGEQLLPDPMPPDKTEAQKATDKAQGQEAVFSMRDGFHLMARTYTYLEIEDGQGGTDKKRLLPYCVVTDLSNNKCVSVVRNWEEKDETEESMVWSVEIPFLPWRGPLTLGLVQFIGSLAGTATGSIRALLDSAHVNNLPTLLKLKGVNFVGQSVTANATEITEIEGGVAGDQDIRKLMMAIPFNPPSLVLLQLLGLVTQEGAAFVQTSLDKLGEQRADMPVGTTLALIEQGLKTLSGIHARLYDAINKCLMILHRINRMYVTDEEIKSDTGEMLAYRADFQGPLDVVPISDPEIFSDIQRFAQMQLVAQRATTLPQLYDLRKVEELILARTKIPDAKSLLLPEQKAEEMNQVNENVAMAMGRPVVAFPEQGHLAHIQVLLDFLQNPWLGMSPLIGPKFIPAALNHLAEHMLMWYANEFYEVINAELPHKVNLGDLMSPKDPEAKKELDKTLAEASPEIMKESETTFAQVPAIIQKAQAFMQQFAPQAPPDPSLQKEQLVQQGKDKDRQAQQAIAGQKDQSETQRVAIREQAANARNTTTINTKHLENQEDNMTALTIAKAEIQGNERIKVSTGTGINP